VGVRSGYSSQSATASESTISLRSQIVTLNNQTEILKTTMQIIQSIQNRIYEIRGERVMLDFDIAQLYEVETKALNQAVKRNLKRFPEDFMFRLTLAEWEAMRSQSVTASKGSNSMRSQSVTTYEPNKSTMSQIVTTSQQSRRKDRTPYAITEQGFAILSGILNSGKAINMNIAIMRAFVEVRKILLKPTDLKNN